MKKLKATTMKACEYQMMLYFYGPTMSAYERHPLQPCASTNNSLAMVTSDVILLPTSVIAVAALECTTMYVT